VVTGRRKRLSADLPQHWLHDQQFWTLSDRAWRLLTHALMWAVGRTDGQIPASMLSMLLPGTDQGRQAAADELVAAGVWADDPIGWRFVDWEGSQSTVEEIGPHRAKWRDKKAKQRANVPQGTPPGESTGGVRNGTERYLRTNDQYNAGTRSADLNASEQSNG
jgi:hypothetical protein